MIEIWESKALKQGLTELPVIIPLVIYHDKGEWRIKTKLSNLESVTRIIIKIMRDVRHASKEKVMDIIAEGFTLLDEIIEKDEVIMYFIIF